MSIPPLGPFFFTIVMLSSFKCIMLTASIKDIFFKPGQLLSQAESNYIHKDTVRYHTHLAQEEKLQYNSDSVKAH